MTDQAFKTILLSLAKQFAIPGTGIKPAEVIKDIRDGLGEEEDDAHVFRALNDMRGDVKKALVRLRRESDLEIGTCGAHETPSDLSARFRA